MRNIDTYCPDPTEQDGPYEKRKYQDWPEDETCECGGLKAWDEDLCDDCFKAQRERINKLTEGQP